jgi:hypothetical protein
MHPDALDLWPLENEPPLEFAIRDLRRGLANGSYIKPTLTNEERTRIIDLLQRTEELPLADRLKPILFLAQTVSKRGHGPTPFALAARNGVIIATINKIVRHYKGISATKNRTTKDKESAASIVSDALSKLGKGRSEATINKIHEQFRRQWG